MSNAARRATSGTKVPVAQGFGDLRIPAGFEGGVRREDAPSSVLRNTAQPASVKKVADAKAGLFVDSISRYNDKLATLTKKGKPKEEAMRAASSELDAAAEMIKRYAVEMKGTDGEPAVTADMAAALMELSPPERQMILRRAGNPEAFASLENAELDAVPVPDADARRKELAGAGEKERKKTATQFNRDKLPPHTRPSQFFQQHGVATTTGTPVKPSEVYKKRLPNEFDPMQASADKPEAKDALKQLAGDQISELSMIQRRQLVESKLLTQAEVDKLSQADLQKVYADMEKQNAVPGVRLPQVKTLSQKEQDIQRLVEAGLVGEGAPISAEDARKLSARDRREYLASVGSTDVTAADASKDTLRTGTRTDPNSQFSAKAGRADQEIAKRNKSGLERRVEMLYTMTEDSVDTDAATGAARLDHRGAPVRAQMAPKVLDLDRYFPWWRARVGVAQPDGTLTFPKKQKSAEWVTSMMQGWLNVHDPDFFRRMLPLVQRSIEAMPDRPVRTATEGGVVLGGGRALKAKSAADWEKETWVPSPDMHENMKGGPGTGAYVYAVYGDKDIELDDVQAGAGTPQPVYNVEESPAYKKMMQKRDERAAQPGKMDTSSINPVSEYSPLRSLIA